MLTVRLSNILFGITHVVLIATSSQAGPEQHYKSPPSFSFWSCRAPHHCPCRSCLLLLLCLRHPRPRPPRVPCYPRHRPCRPGLVLGCRHPQLIPKRRRRPILVVPLVVRRSRHFVVSSSSLSLLMPYHRCRLVVRSPPSLSSSLCGRRRHRISPEKFSK